VELHCSRNAGHPKLLPWPSNTAPTRENSGDRKPGRRLAAFSDGLCGTGHDADPRAV